MIRVEQIQGVSNSVGRILEEMRKNLLKEKNYIPQLSSGRGMTQENKQAVKTLEENLKKKDELLKKLTEIHEENVNAVELLMKKY